MGQLAGDVAQYGGYAGFVAVIWMLIQLLTSLVSKRHVVEDDASVYLRSVEAAIVAVNGKLSTLAEIEAKSVEREGFWLQALDKLSAANQDIASVLKSMSLEVHDTRRDVAELKMAYSAR